MNLDKVLDRIVTEIGPCCKKVCEDLNEEIKARKQLASTRSLGTATQFYPSILHGINALEDLRNRLEEEGICKCTSDKKVPITDIPQVRKSERKRYSTTISAGLTRFSKSGKPISSSHIPDNCCTDVCRTLNDQIRSIDDILDASVIKRASIEIEPMQIESMRKEEMGRLPMKKEEMEKRAMRKAEWEMSLNEKFMSLAYQSYTLKEYRTIMKKNNVCKCEL